MKFWVTVLRETPEKASILIEAADEAAAKVAAEELVLNGEWEELAGIKWHPTGFDEARAIDVVKATEP